MGGEAWTPDSSNPESMFEPIEMPSGYAENISERGGEVSLLRNSFSGGP
jgi:hypothetical protein